MHDRWAAGVQSGHNAPDRLGRLVVRRRQARFGSATDGTARVWRFDGSTLTEALRLSADDLAGGVEGCFVLTRRQPPRRGRLWHGVDQDLRRLPTRGRRAVQPRGRADAGGAITGDQVVTVGRDGFVRTTDLSTGRELRRLDEPQVGGLRRLAEVDPPGNGSRCSPSTSRR